MRDRRALRTWQARRLPHDLPHRYPSAVNRKLIPIAAFTFTYMTAALIYGLISGNYEFVFYVVILIPVIVGIAVLHARVGLSAPVLWGLSAWGLIHMLGGTLAIPPNLAEPDTPAVLYNLPSLQPGAGMSLVMEDGQQFDYALDYIRLYDVATELTPEVIQTEVVGPTDREAITMITCGGEFDYNAGHYLQRYVARAYKV